MIAVAVVAGLAGFWVWTVLNDDTGMFGFMTRLLSKNAVTEKWMTCPWCSGAWFSGAASLLLFHDDLIPAVIIAIAAAAITGALGSYFQGD